MSTNIAALFSTGDAVSGKGPKKAGQIQGVYQDVEGELIPDTKTVNRWACAIEERYPVEVRPITGVGHSTNLYGCWVFEKYRQTALGDRKEGKHERLRYADATQMEEIYKALTDHRRFWALVNSTDEDGNPVELPGPYRKGKGPVNAKGLPILEEANVGNFGPLPDECGYIEQTDKALIQYRGTDEIWANGCWQIEKAGFETQYLDADGIKYVAHTILGMPANYKRKVRPKKAPASPVASLFAESPGLNPGELWQEGIGPEEKEALYVQHSDWGSVPNATPIADLSALREWGKGPYGQSASYIVKPEQVQGLRNLFGGGEDDEQQPASIRSLFT